MYRRGVILPAVAGSLRLLRWFSVLPGGQIDQRKLRISPSILGGLRCIAVRRGATLTSRSGGRTVSAGSVTGGGDRDVGTMPLGLLLRRHRERLGLTQEELAERGGHTVSVSTVRNVEQGRTRPYRHTLECLMAALELDDAARTQVLAHWRGQARTRGWQAAHPDPMASRPSGPAVRTFLVAGLRGHTRSSRVYDDGTAGVSAARLAAPVGQAAAEHGGDILALREHESRVVFRSSRPALEAAARLQQLLERESATDSSLPLKAGIGLDTGERLITGAGDRWAALDAAVRLCRLAGPGEILAGDAVTRLAGRIEGLAYRELGMIYLKGLADPVNVHRIEPERPGRPAAPAAAAVRPRAGTQILPIGGFLGSLPAGPLVARERELRRALGLAVAAHAGAGQMLLLVGEAGAGKTRLAQEMTLEVRNRGFLVAAGCCHEGERTVPYYPFCEALASLHDACPPAVRADVPHRWPDVHLLLPGTRTMRPGRGAGAGGPEEYRPLWAVTGFVNAVADFSPVALFLDDLQWADGSSLMLLQHLARHTRTHAVLIVATYRDVDVGRGHPLEGVLRDFRREALAERIDVRPLDEGETGALIATTLGVEAVSPELVTLVHDRTEGNPLFVQQVTRMLVEREDIFRRDGHWTHRQIDQIEVPEGARSVIGQRLSSLSEVTLDVLREASILGQTFKFDDLAAIGGRSEWDLEVALEEAVGRALLREVGRDSYAFDHALTQQTLGTEISAHRRWRLRRRAGDAPVGQLSPGFPVSAPKEGDGGTHSCSCYACGRTLSIP